MTDLAEPRDVSELSRRIFAIRPILLTVFVCLLFISELRYDWLERALGAYLVSTNHMRPESGTIWEKGHQTRRAQNTLEKIISDKQTSQREAQSATSLKQVAANVTPDQGVVLPADHFRRLYIKIPQTLALEIISPYDLLQLSSAGRWRRTYFEKSDAGLTAYLLDAGNRVLMQIEIPANLFLQPESEDFIQAETLNDFARFQKRIYSADLFFSTLEEFPEEVRRSMVPHPERLLELPGKVTRVGISDEAVSGFIEIGFEITDGTRNTVVRIQGNEWAVWRLRAKLEKKSISSGTTEGVSGKTGIFMENSEPDDLNG